MCGGGGGGGALRFGQGVNTLDSTILMRVSMDASKSSYQ